MFCLPVWERFISFVQESNNFQATIVKKSRSSQLLTNKMNYIKDFRTFKIVYFIPAAFVAIEIQRAAFSQVTQVLKTKT